jgi:hypothetical protein
MKIEIKRMQRHALAHRRTGLNRSSGCLMDIAVADVGATSDHAQQAQRLIQPFRL